LAERESNRQQWSDEDFRLSSRAPSKDLSATPAPESRRHLAESRQELAERRQELAERRQELAERRQELAERRPVERFYRSDVTELSPPFSEDFETGRRDQMRSEYPPKSADAQRARATSVNIPRPPRLPQLELDTIEDLAPSRERSEFRMRRSERCEVGERETIRTPPPEGSYTVLPPRSSAVSESLGFKERPSHVPLSSRNAEQAAPLSSRGARIYFAPHLRIQARSWLESGSFSLPGVTSPRHSRALQRALLLSMLHEPGWGELPDGLKQRAGLLFCEGWESSSAAAHPFREIDDLATVLGLACTTESRTQLSYSVAAHLPRDFPRRTTLRPPPHSR
jgi:hypothetical protein